jgi:UDP-GlcNAc:undecaprenyl-phosphate GlcNAc-1-phosphate transferase
VREYVLTLLVAAATTYLLVGLAGRVAHLVGAVPPTRDRDVHREPVPRLGGTAMLAGMLAGLLVASYLPRMSAVFRESDDARALLTAAVVICAVGVADDVWGLGALTKLAGQLLAAGLLVVQGVQLIWLPLPSGPLVLDPVQGSLLTVLLVVATVNAVNFVDGLDGLAAGVVGIGALAFFSYAYLLTVEQGVSRLTTPAMVTVILAGMCLGFLPHNVNPARIFMGDSGSMLIGLLLAASSITLTGKFDSQVVGDASVLPALLPLVLPVAVIAVPFTDLLLAVTRRTRAGRSPFAPDKQHLHHRLLEIGHSHRRAVVVMWIWTALVAFGVVVVALVGGWQSMVGVGVVLVLTVALTLWRPRGLLGRPA